jgi:hypothetical protein
LGGLNGAPGGRGIWEISSATDLTLTGNWNIGQIKTIFVNFTNPGSKLIINPQGGDISINPNAGIMNGRRR